MGEMGKDGECLCVEVFKRAILNGFFALLKIHLLNTNVYKLLVSLLPLSFPQEIPPWILYTVYALSISSLQQEDKVIQGSLFAFDMLEQSSLYHSKSQVQGTAS